MATAYEQLAHGCKVLKTVYSADSDMLVSMMTAGAVSIASNELNASVVTDELVTKVNNILISLEINKLPSVAIIAEMLKNIKDAEQL